MLIKNAAPRIVGFGGLFRLLPGVNEVDAASWEKVKDSTFSKWYLEQGLVEIIHEPKSNGKISELSGDGSKNDSSAIKKLAAKKALEIIKETYDPALLNKWAQTETRKQVLKAIEDQAQSLKL